MSNPKLARALQIADELDKFNARPRDVIYALLAAGFFPAESLPAEGEAK